jgi:hypothetical protein
MKTFYGSSCIRIAIVVLVVATVLFAGCTSEPEKVQGSPAAAVTSGDSGGSSLPHGVSIAVPSAWTREDLLTSSDRDYGRNVVTIARYTSPVTIPGDTASKNTLTIDYDQDPGGDFEVYFNQATLALEESYKTQLDSHSIVKSSTLDISGYKSYELDFQTSEVKGSYIFTSTEYGMYIFAFKGPNQQVPVHTLQGEMTGIIRSIRLTPGQ